MGGIMPKAPAMPSAEEQFRTQQRLQEEAESKAVEKAEKERRVAGLEEQRRQKRRRGASTLITKRPGGLLGDMDDSLGTGSDYQSLFKIG